MKLFNIFCKCGHIATCVRVKSFYDVHFSTQKVVTHVDKNIYWCGSEKCAPAETDFEQVAQR